MRWVIGDIHGMLRPLRALLHKVAQADADARLYFVGDYVNRGPDSRGVIDLLLTLPNARFVRGNHDDILDMVLHGQSYGGHPEACTPAAAFLWFIHYGLVNTLESYDAEWLDVEWVRHHPSDQAVRRLFERVPGPHRAFIRALEPVIEEDNLFVAHAMWNPDDPDGSDGSAPIAEQLARDPRLRHQILWGRFTNEMSRRKRWRRTGYFGHTPVGSFPPSLRPGGNVPIRGPGLVLLDTGAALGPTGRLSAVCADNGQLLQVDRIGGEVKAE